jgi:hypothetical protein
MMEDVKVNEVAVDPDPEKALVQEFVRKNFERCQMWFAAHGNSNFPIVKLPNGHLSWVPRATRRKLMRARFKARRLW